MSNPSNYSKFRVFHRPKLYKKNVGLIYTVFYLGNLYVYSDFDPPPSAETAIRAEK